MNYEELMGLVGGNNPQSATYQDIVSGIQSQYRPQTEFAPTRSLLDSMGTLVPEQRGIAYGSLLQAQPRVLPTNLSGTAKSSNAIGGLTAGDLSNINTAKTTNLSDLTNALTVGDGVTGGTNLTTTGVNNGLFADGITGANIAKVAGTVVPIAALAGNSDLVKTAIALNLIGSAADIRTEADVINLGTKIALLAAGPYGNALAAGLGIATDNTPMTVNALLGLANPTLGLVNTIVSNLTGQSLGTLGSGLLSAPEGSISNLGLLGASNYGNAIDRSAKDVNDMLRDAITSGQGCPAPWIEILLADGGIVQAGDIKVGMKVYTRHETTNEWGVYPVIAVEMGEDERWEVVLDDGRIFVGTFNHRVHTGDDWTEIRDLKAGDKLIQTDGYGTVQYSKQLDHGPIVKITVADAHTYISEGFLSHNVKILESVDGSNFNGSSFPDFWTNRAINAE
jgi:hypothetical protein